MSTEDENGRRFRRMHPRFETFSRRVEMVVPDGANEDRMYGSPEAAALAQPRRLDQIPRLVSVVMRDEDRADVEIDMGRHPADRLVYRCERESDGRWWVSGDSHWFDEKPVTVEVARPSDDLGVFIVESSIGGYELVITGYEFASTHLSHHATIEEAKQYAESNDLTDLDWRPWTPE